MRRLEANAGRTPPLIVPELVDAQMRALYELGFERIRVTISFDRFGPDFLAAIPYVRAARALGMDVLGVIGQFTGFDLLQAISNPQTRDEVLETYVAIFGDFVQAAPGFAGLPGGFSAQVLNEPTHFAGLAPDVYVRDYLRPAYFHLKEDDPSMTIVAAAPVGSAEGLLRARVMIETGLENYCDRVAYHVYSTRFLRELGTLSDQPTWITESGAAGTEHHVDWMTRTFDEIRAAIPRTERIYWFNLFDFEPGAFRLIDLGRTADGGFEPVVESHEAVALLRSRIEAAAGGAELVPYRELLPDITLYFPTDEDERRIRSTSIGSSTWPS
ncbi:MAG TPA: hypothetical protein VEK15_01185 [Vicinamibacteria bacterium]|nr:hypothetical protein [Vicinamibacteria bacterium]